MSPLLAPTSPDVPETAAGLADYPAPPPIRDWHPDTEWCSTVELGEKGEEPDAGIAPCRWTRARVDAQTDDAGQGLHLRRGRHGFRGFGKLLRHLASQRVVELRRGSAEGDPEVTFPED